MSYVKVVLGLPVEGPFDYAVPEALKKEVFPGKRAWVSFGPRKQLGYIVALSRTTQIKSPKKILEVVDEHPLIDKNLLFLTRELARYYGCSWGEAIETALPRDLRKGRKIQFALSDSDGRKAKEKRERILIHDLDGAARWDIYLSKIKETLAGGESVIVLLPDYRAVLKAKERIAAFLNSEPAILHRGDKKETEEWAKIKEGRVAVVLATRSGVFAPLARLGLLIIEDEHNWAYKQDQVPHYHARTAALMRVNHEKAGLILGSPSPSLESIYLAGKNKMSYTLIPRKTVSPEIKIIDMKHLSYADRKKNLVFSKYLIDSVYSVLSSKGKTLLFINRKGFATVAYCLSCGSILKCPRCNVNLVFHFSQSALNCHYCNFKTEPPKICPLCNAGYIKYSGTGAEKIESELARIFPSAALKRIDGQDNFNLKDADIFISTSAIIKQGQENFDLIGVLAIDNTLSRVDFRAAERAFALLAGLWGMTDKKIIIQTGLVWHACFQALLKKDVNSFYEEELKQRKQLNFPPYKHMILVKLRGKKEERVEGASRSLFDRISEYNKHKDIRLVSVNPATPSKLRGNFCWQLLIIASKPEKASTFLKICLKKFPHSGIIITVDVDPV